LIPDPRPLRVEEGGKQFFGHIVDLRAFPKECEGPIQVIYDRLIGLDFRDETILPDRVTDLVLVQATGRSFRSVQEVLYWLEIGPTACRRLMALERTIRQTAAELARLAGIPDPGDHDRARAAALEAQHRSARAELDAMRDRRARLKAELGKVTGRLGALTRKREPDAADRALADELFAKATRIRAELINEDSVILRHSGPGFHGRRRIELLAQLAGRKPKEREKARPAADAAAKARPAADAAAKGKGKAESVYNRGSRGFQEEQGTAFAPNSRARQEQAPDPELAAALEDLKNFRIRRAPDDS
jgi:hypothetical protein